MDRLAAPIALAFSVLISGALAAATEGPESGYVLGQAVPLDEEDLKDITLQVMQKRPLVSSSSGIKAASAQRSVRSTDIASVIYFPHVESAGVKQAFQVRCVRQAPSTQWICEDPELRAYLRLDSQDFEVRVTVAVTMKEALALIEATRATVQQSRPAGAAIPQTAIMISTADSSHSSYLVSWGNEQGHNELTVEARPIKGGNQSDAEGWQASLWEPKE